MAEAYSSASGASGRPDPGGFRVVDDHTEADAGFPDDPATWGLDQLADPWDSWAPAWRAARDEPPPPAWTDADDVFDRVGLRPGRLLVIGGEPGSGKSALMMQMLAGCLLRNPTLRVVVASVEMTAEQCFDRLLSWRSRVPLTRIQQRRTTDDDAPRIAAADAVLDAIGPRIWFCKDPYSLRAVVRLGELVRADVLALDFIQEQAPASAPGEGEEYARLSALIRDVGRLCIERQLAVVAVSQLRRSSGAGYGRPGLASLRGSGNIESRATDIILLSRHPDGPHPAPDHDDAPTKRGTPVGMLFDHVKSKFDSSYARRLIFDGALATWRRPTPDDDLGPTSAGPPDPSNFRPPGATAASPAPGATPAADDPDDDPDGFAY